MSRHFGLRMLMAVSLVIVAGILFLIVGGADLITDSQFGGLKLFILICGAGTVGGIGASIHPRPIFGQSNNQIVVDLRADMVREEDATQPDTAREPAETENISAPEPPRLHAVS